MKIFFEVGNSRIKAAIVDRKYEFLGAVDNKFIEDLTLAEVFEIDDEECDAIFIASVASHSLTSQLIKLCQDVWGIYPVLVTTQPESCGVKCGYENFETLGIDRWLGIVAVASNSSKPLIVVSAGTALTVDVVIDKTHRGGFIVPGLGLMYDALNVKTALINVDESNDDPSYDLLATSTENAVSGGVLYMLSSYLNSLITELESETGRLFDCIATGGDFERLEPLLDKEFDYVIDLSIRGMVEVVENC